MNDMRNIEDIYELSPLQQGMMFHSLFAPDSGLYIEQISFPLSGPLDMGAFSEAWNRLLERYAVLRTSFHWDDLAKPLQVVHRGVTLPIEQLDWGRLSAAEQASNLEKLLLDDRARGFVLSEAPLMRLTLIRLSNDAWQFLLSFHHILLDGWSLQLLFRDFATLYKAACLGQDVRLEATRPYGDYIAWLQEQDLTHAEAFWRRTLRGFTAPTSLRVDRRADEDAEERYEEQEIRLSASATGALQAAARVHKLTLNTIVQAAWALLLSRYSDQDDVVYGAIVSGRPAELSGVESMVGMFINTIPLRTRVRPDDSLLDLLKEVHAHQFEARQFEHSPLLLVQGWSEIGRGTPLYESILVFENYPMARAPEGASSSDEFLDFRCVERTNVPLTVTIIPARELHIKILYDTRRFEPAVVERMLGHYRRLLEAMADNLEQRIADVSILTEPERHRILFEWNDTEQEYDREQTIAARFEAQVQKTPYPPSFVSDGRTISYGELNLRANKLAHHLRSLGVGPEVFVGICLERSLDLVVALMGVIKAGGVYVPLDPSYPKHRLAYILDDTRAPVLITRAGLEHLVPAPLASVIRIDADRNVLDQQSSSNLDVGVSADNAAYVIYTSGSTGVPKGVVVPYRQLYNRFAWMWEAYPFTTGEVACQKTSLNFVDSLWELLGGLLQGIPTVIVPDDVIVDPEELVRLLARHRVSRIWVVPSLLRMLLDSVPDLQRRAPSLKFWVTSGEPISPELYDMFRRQMPSSRLYNLYGTSEVWDVTWCALEEDDSSAAVVPIGRPISNMRAYVVGSDGRLVPVGVPGELLIGGDGLARRYLNDDALTDEKFVADRFSGRPGERLYRSGDIVRWRSDGALDFLGRMDHQVKVRGYRIELGEIEATLVQHASVRQAVAVARDEGDAGKRLVAYIVPEKSAAVSPGALRSYLESKVPAYMIPSAFVTLAALPLGPSGKVDRSALPAPVEVPPHLPASDNDAPLTTIEEQLVQAYREVLHQDQIRVHDNFFADLGGHSLLATQLASLVCSRLDVQLPLRVFFEAPTVAALAEAVDLARQAPKEDGVPRLARVERDKYRVNASL